MQLIAPDLYEEVTRLSGGACALGLVVAVLLWLTGWWQHRFWLVASLTTAAGIVGLQQGRSGGVSLDPRVPPDRRAARGVPGGGTARRGHVPVVDAHADQLPRRSARNVLR